MLAIALLGCFLFSEKWTMQAILECWLQVNCYALIVKLVIIIVVVTKLFHKGNSQNYLKYLNLAYIL